VTTVRAAWDGPWFQIHGTTEVTTLGAHCSHHTGLHLFEDLAIVEVVDENDRPVPARHTGHRLLVANLVVAPSEPCLCLRPFRLVPGIEGRNDDILYLPGAAGGRVAVHPLALRSPLTEVADLAQYQIRCTDARLIVRASLRSAAPADVLDSLATSMSNRSRVVLPHAPERKRPWVPTPTSTCPRETRHPGRSSARQRAGMRCSGSQAAPGRPSARIARQTAPLLTFPYIRDGRSGLCSARVGFKVRPSAR
jgi:hypothetical protein